MEMKRKINENPHANPLRLPQPSLRSCLPKTKEKRERKRTPENKPKIPNP
jgi:hypothetical protein